MSGRIAAVSGICRSVSVVISVPSFAESSAQRLAADHVRQDRFARIRVHPCPYARGRLVDRFTRHD